jgi:hypothetical protein
MRKPRNGPRFLLEHKLIKSKRSGHSDLINSSAKDGEIGIVSVQLSTPSCSVILDLALLIPCYN